MITLHNHESISKLTAIMRSRLKTKEDNFYPPSGSPGTKSQCPTNELCCFKKILFWLELFHFFLLRWQYLWSEWTRTGEHCVSSNMCAGLISKTGSVLLLEFIKPFYEGYSLTRADPIVTITFCSNDLGDRKRKD